MASLALKGSARVSTGVPSHHDTGCCPRPALGQSALLHSAQWERTAQPARKNLGKTRPAHFLPSFLGTFVRGRESNKPFQPKTRHELIIPPVKSCLALKLQIFSLNRYLSTYLKLLLFEVRFVYLEEITSEKSPGWYKLYTT